MIQMPIRRWEGVASSCSLQLDSCDAGARRQQSPRQQIVAERLLRHDSSLTQSRRASSLTRPRRGLDDRLF